MIYIKNKQIKDSEYPDLIIATYSEKDSYTNISLYFHNEICDFGYKYVFRTVIETINSIVDEILINMKISFDNEQNYCLYLKIALKYIKENLLKKEKDYYRIDKNKINNFKYKKLIPNILYPLEDNSLNIKQNDNFFKVNQDVLFLKELFDYYKKFKKGRFIPLENKIKEKIPNYEISMIENQKDVTQLMDNLSLVNEYVELSGWNEGKQIIKNSLEFIYNKNESDKKTISKLIIYYPLLKYNKKVAINIIRSYISYNFDSLDLNRLKEIIYEMKNDRFLSKEFEKAIYMFRDELKKHY